MGLGYDMVYAAGLLLAGPVLAARMLLTGKWRTDWPARLGRTPPVHGRSVGQARKPTLLIHAVSVGEVNAAAGLVRLLHERTHGAWRIVVSATTDTGVERATTLFSPVHRVVRFPFDFTFAVRRFLDAVEPDAVALMELEVWPNFLDECRRRGVPVCVVNGRLSARSFKRYHAARALVSPMFSKLAAAFVQTQDYADRFRALGARDVSVTDTMKWDAATLREPGEVEGVDALARAMGIDRGKPVIVAGSTGPGEEKLLIETKPRDAQLVLVPRRPERFDEVAQLAPGIVRRSQHRDGAAPTREPAELFLVDTMGELMKAYALADVAIVGRSFLGMHGSNPIEPVSLGRPTVIGPFHSDFADTVDALRLAGGIVVTDRPGDEAARLLVDRAAAAELAKRGRDVILSRQGATARHAAALIEMMEREALSPQPSANR